ncbi:DIBOA-glucoside dioxygenase BX6-like [Hordeum vulgare subsp. vulgare]|uniref:DIBOA-glucoside dioxygenase BX6-like n=1 Tax=Hordeum vulgare subsp. vulgare TaxID=112509 RepID=UPI001D1A5979|nr:DIBOA-glucoside dioxygenase BX6-like [Hordeum vulgare subsp. vulgare]
MNKIANDELPPVQFVANGCTYNYDYYLADEIYPKWQTFVNPLKKPEGVSCSRALLELRARAAFLRGELHFNGAARASAARRVKPDDGRAMNQIFGRRAFDDTKAGVKGLGDAGITIVPVIFHSTSSSSFVTIPVIDLTGLTTSSGRASVVGAVRVAAETVGFFQVVNHAVPEEAMPKMLAAVRRFNEEPAEARATYYYYSRDLGRPVRYKCNFDLFQSPAANWRDTLLLEIASEPPVAEEIPPECRRITPEYAGLVPRLGRTLLGLLSEALSLRRGYLEQDAACLRGSKVKINIKV